MVRFPLPARVSDVVAFGLVLGTAVVSGCASVPATGSSTGSWSVTVLGDSSDSRFTAVREAAEYWNHQLAELGVPIRFASVTASSQRLPETLLQELSATVVARERAERPRELDSIPGDVVVALSSDPYITSIGINRERFGGRALVVLRPGDVPPLSLPNVARNVAAHEMGHVLGLRHNTEPGTLMCMPPAPCRPMSFRSDTARFFPLTSAERLQLTRRWSARQGNAALDSAARRIVAFLTSGAGFDAIALADTVELRIAPEGGGTSVRVARESLRAPRAWQIRANAARYSFVPPPRLTRMSTRVGRHFNCQEYALATRAPDLARYPHVGVKLETDAAGSCLASWNATFVFDTAARAVPVLIAALYDQWEW